MHGVKTFRLLTAHVKSFRSNHPKTITFKTVNDFPGQITLSCIGLDD